MGMAHPSPQPPSSIPTLSIQELGADRRDRDLNVAFRLSGTRMLPSEVERCTLELGVLGMGAHNTSPGGS